MTKSKVTKEFAQRIGRKIPMDWTYEQVRDWLDQATGAELDNTQLNLLTDWALQARALWNKGD